AALNPVHEAIEDIGEPTLFDTEDEPLETEDQPVETDEPVLAAAPVIEDVADSEARPFAQEFAEQEEEQEFVEEAPDDLEEEEEAEPVLAAREEHPVEEP